MITPRTQLEEAFAALRKDLVNESFLNISGARNKSWEYYCGTHFMIYNEHTIHEIIAIM